jgi:hypothetical protein
MFDETDQPVVVFRIEEFRDVGVQNPVRLVSPGADRQRVALVASGAEAVAEAQEVFLPDGVQHFDQRALDDLVFQRGDARWALPSVGLRNEDPA